MPLNLRKFGVYLSILFLARMCVSQEGQTLSGYVKDLNTRRPIANALVSAVGGAAKSDEPTDVRGRFLLTLSRSVKRGDNVRIQVTKPGYETYDEIVTVSTIALEFVLTPKLKPPKQARKSRPDTPVQNNVDKLAAQPPVRIDPGYRWESLITIENAAGDPVPNVHVLLIAANATYIEGLSDSAGHVFLKSQVNDKPRTVFCAVPLFAARLERGYSPNKTLIITLKAKPTGGSLLIRDGVGELPGLSGLLNPILDTLGRTYIYAHNVAINDGKLQPVNFSRNEPLKVEDNENHRFRVVIIEIIGSSSLLEYDKEN
ncbi:MAG TPA: hypothetical protein VMT67_08585 [Terriglobales bacterium]|nr:hypothetical protein [Terriglobales bacterium]